MIQTIQGQEIRRVVVPYGGWSHEANYSSTPWVVKGLKRLNLDVYTLQYQSSTFLKELLSLAPDVVFPQTLGAYGEDGTLQALLDRYDLPYVGSGVCASALGMNKALFGDTVRSIGQAIFNRHLCFTTPYALIASQEYQPAYSDVVRALGSPFIVKPLASGASFGIYLIEEEPHFWDVFEQAMRDFHVVLFEQYVTGHEYTVGILEDDANSIDLSVCSIRKERALALHTQNSKLDTALSEYIIPKTLDTATIQRLQQIARTIFTRLRCQSFARIDLILADDGTVYVLEINTLPGIIPQLSAFPKMCEAQGISYDEMLLMLLKSAFRPQAVMPKLQSPPPAPVELLARTDDVERGKMIECR